ncbi:MAG: DAHL domain-containing protein, partial [Actinomycetota bacterium]
MNIRLKHIAIGIGLILLMTFLFFKTNVIDSDAHNRFSRDLHHLKEVDATLDKDILESRYGLLNSYDLLTTDTVQIDQLQENLKNIPAFINQDGKEEINKLLKNYAELDVQKEIFIERFKSRNSIINNSIRYFPVTTSNLIKNLSTKSAKPNGLESLNNLLKDTLIYYLLTETELEPEITKHIEKLNEFKNKQLSSEDKTDLEISISHAQTILKLKPEVDTLIKETVALPTADQIEELIKLYDSYYGQSLSRANSYRLLLYVFSVLLLVCIAYIIVRLKQATKSLNSVNENLEQRVQERTEELLLTNTELQNSRDYFNRIINAVGDPIFVKNRRHQLTLVNDAMVNFMGRSRNEAIGTVEHDLFPAEEADVFWEQD